MFVMHICVTQPYAVQDIKVNVDKNSLEQKSFEKDKT